MRSDLKIQDISARFGAVAALDGVSLDIHGGEILSLLGPSGSGKSTLLRVIAGITRASGGRILIDGLEVEGPGCHVEAEWRRVGMVFQDFALFPHLTVAENVGFGLRHLSRPDAEATVAALLGRVGLGAMAGRYPHMLSGGERQRVALARALAPGPRVLLMDEPFSSLDDRLRDRVRHETVTLLRDTGTTTIIVTHDPGEAMTVGDRIALLRNGRLLQCGSAEELYAHPTTAFAARFFSDVNELPGTCRGGVVRTPLGVFPVPHARENTPVRVCIRPEHIRIAKGPGPAAVPARVLTAEFHGEIDRLTLDVPGLDDPLAVRAFGRARVEPGSALYLEVDVSNAVVLPEEVEIAYEQTDTVPA